MKTRAIAILSIFTFAILTSCVKEGCTDPTALNYDADANSENLSCNYSGNMVFWCTKTRSDSLIDDGHVLLRFELGGEIIDSIATASFFSSTGGCNNSGTKTFTKEFHGNTVYKYKYRVYGDNWVELYEGYVEAKANDCVGVQLIEY